MIVTSSLCNHPSIHLDAVGPDMGREFMADAPFYNLTVMELGSWLKTLRSYLNFTSLLDRE